MLKMKVLFVGDSRKMKGGVSTVIKTLEKSALWQQYHCDWIETQINSRSKIFKVLYLLKGVLRSIYILPQYDVIHFQTTPGSGMITLSPIFLYTLLWRKKSVVQLHMGNQIKNYVNNYTFRFWAKYADSFIFLGKTWENEIRPFLPQSMKTFYLYNPVPNHEKQKEYDKYFFYAAYFNENKGCDIFLKAFSKIAVEYPDWKVVMCGTGNVTLVERMITEYHLETKVEMPGWVEGNKKIKYFKNAFAYCMTSYQEGLPMSVLESMSYGIPVISTPVGCLPEILKDGESVLFFDFGNADALAECMSRMIKDEMLRRKILNNSYDLAKENFNIESVVDKLCKIYKLLYRK